MVVLVRVDLNVPVQSGRVVDDFRIKKAIPTIDYLRSRGAKVVLMSHIDGEGSTTLAPVASYLKMLGLPVTFIENYRNAPAVINVTKPGECVLLENLRLHDGEKSNDREFAKELASLGDVYVNDAFAVSHRDHASVSAITSFIPSYAGLLLETEIKNLSTAFNPGRPFLFILGGAKFDTKMPIIEKFIATADKVFVGGALSSNFFKEKGMEIGVSVASTKSFDLSRYFSNPKLMLPVDAVVAKGEQKTVKKVDQIMSDEAMWDAGPETMTMLSQEIKKAKYILWNGPLGGYEKGYKAPTLELARLISEATAHGATTILGGGDTLATITELGIADQFTFVSTGGGAMLDFLANETLPGIKALEASFE